MILQPPFPSPLCGFLQYKVRVASILIPWPPLSAEVYVSETPFNHPYNDWWLPVVKPQLLIHHRGST